MKFRSTRWLLGTAASALLLAGGLAARAQDTGDDTAPPPPPPPPPGASAPAATPDTATPPPPAGGPGGFRRGGRNAMARFNGTVASVTSTGFTFTARRGNETITVTTTPSTTYTDTHDGTVSDVKTGDTLTLVGPADATAKTVTAYRIVDGSLPEFNLPRGGRGGGPGGGAPGAGTPGGGAFGFSMTKGTVVSTAPLKVKDASGVVYTVTPSGPSTVSFSTPGTLSDIQVGKYVVVRPVATPGTPISAATTSVMAQTVIVSPTAPRFGGGGGRGGFGRPGGFGG